MAAGTRKTGGNQAKKSATESRAKRTKKPVASSLTQLRAATTSKPAIKSAKKPAPKQRTKGAAAGSLTQLGAEVRLPASPDAAYLETAANPHPGDLYAVRFTAPEFTALCPMTGQPDFAHLVIDYVPQKLIVESKSLKLFLTSFRNHGAFHEDCTITIAKRIIAAAKPKFLRIGGYWYPRGGIPIDIFYQTGLPPKGLWLPDPGVAPYRGRG